MKQKETRGQAKRARCGRHSALEARQILEKVTVLMEVGPWLQALRALAGLDRLQIWPAPRGGGTLRVGKEKKKEKERREKRENIGPAALL